MEERKDHAIPSVGELPQLIIYWLVVGAPLAWGIWKTVAKLPALFK